MERRGDWMVTASGRKFWPLDPRPEEVFIEDVSHALALQCRFNGSCREFYSVAEHSVRVSLECAPEDALWGLLHDASEAYTGDLIRPLKAQPEMIGFCHVEKALQAVICRRFGLYERMPRSVSHADDVLLATEARDLMPGGGRDWRLMPEPLEVPIHPWDWRVSEIRFLARFRDLTEGAA